MDKMKMELIWRNCRTCPPEETHNECLFITNGDGVFEVEWDNGYWLDYDKCIIRNVDKYGNDFWWADIDQTTAEFFKSVGLFKPTFL